MYFSKSYYGYFLIIAVLIVTVRALWPDQDDVHKREGRSWRLPNTSLPLEYDLHITTWIHREILNFTGNVTIKVLVKESTSELVLHAKDLEIQSIEIRDFTTKQSVGALNARIIDDLLVLALENNGDIFYPEQYVSLRIIYSGVIKENGFGFRTLNYGPGDKNINGAYTLLKPIYARTLLPCYDEPGLKARFAVSVTHGRNVSVISNMEIVTKPLRCKHEMGTTIFRETPRMSTYNLALVITNFEGKYSKNDSVSHRVLRPRIANDCGHFSLRNSIVAMSIFKRYMNASYILPKIDHVDVNLDFNGSMANWGLITYSSNAFFKTRDFWKINRQNRAIAYQWFGGLVSPMWWDSNWLSEGLATYYSYKLTGMIFPSIRAMSHFQTDKCYQNMWLPVIEDVEKPDDIFRMFDYSTYNKAPCLLYLLSIIIGEETFQSGVKDYIKSYAYSNANSDQFFERIQNAIDNSHETVFKINVSEMMKPYFTRPSRPHIAIFRNFSDSNRILIKQTDPWEFEELWQIPLNFAKKDEKFPRSIKYIMRDLKIELDLREYNITFDQFEQVVVSIPGIQEYIIDHDYWYS